MLRFPIRPLLVDQSQAYRQAYRQAGIQTGFWSWKPWPFYGICHPASFMILINSTNKQPIGRDPTVASASSFPVEHYCFGKTNKQTNKQLLTRHAASSATAPLTQLDYAGTV